MFCCGTTGEAPSPGKEDIRDLWNLDRSFSFLNHGSFGATPKSILEAQYQLRMHVETQPVRYYVREIDGRFEKARIALSTFLNADPAGIAFVPNATTGVNTVLRSLDLEAGDEILTTNHVYNACNNAAVYVARKAGAKVVTANISFPVSSPEEIIEAVLSKVTDKTRLLLVDHITSPTALIFPVEHLIPKFREKGIEVLVDGAHAPGMIPLNLKELGATYYTGNCHKWMCAPKGSGFLYVSEEARSKIRPLTISHGANSARTDKSFFHLEFDWTGTDDYSAFFVLPESIAFLESLYPGGVAELMRRNHDLAVCAMRELCDAFSAPPPCPENMLGSMATVLCLPMDDGVTASGMAANPVGDKLFYDYKIEVPVIRWPAAGKSGVRVSAQAYNRREDYVRLIEALKEILGHRQR